MGARFHRIQHMFIVQTRLTHDPPNSKHLVQTEANPTKLEADWILRVYYFKPPIPTHVPL
jgi:hypothetical protein